jgi:hypothetical protein
MSKLRAHSFSTSIDGFGAGPNQDLQNPAQIKTLPASMICWLKTK